MYDSAEPNAAADVHERGHGGLRDAELQALGLRSADILDFSTSCNPYAPFPAVVRAIEAAPLDRYPDPTAHRARAALAHALRCERTQVTLGNGAAELLWTLARATISPGTSVLIVEPTFCEFRLAAERTGARLHTWRAHARDHFAIDLKAVLAQARSCAADLLYLCTPNTPCGTPLPAAAVAAAAAAHPRLLFVLDQSFLSLSTRFADLACALPDNVVCIRSLTKEQGIPGVRVGYLRATPALVDRIERERPAWTTSAHAQAATIAACETHELVACSRAQWLEARLELEQGLQALDLRFEPSSTGFLAVRTGSAAELRDRLLRRHRILVRDCTSFGLPDHIRVAARPAPDRARLLTALQQEFACSPPR